GARAIRNDGRSSGGEKRADTRGVPCRELHIEVLRRRIGRERRQLPLRELRVEFLIHRNLPDHLHFSRGSRFRDGNARRSSRQPRRARRAAACRRRKARAPISTPRSDPAPAPTARRERPSKTGNAAANAPSPPETRETTETRLPLRARLRSAAPETAAAAAAL